MKLIYCPKCEDIVSLSLYMKHCSCMASYGEYIDELNVEIGGKAIPLGITNQSFADALQNRPMNGQGRNFVAFVIHRKCDTVKEINL